MPKDDNRKVLLTRCSLPIADAVQATAKRLGMSQNAYVEAALARAVTLDADRVALANQQHRQEIDRLSEAANALIRLTHKDGK